MVVTLGGSAIAKQAFLKLSARWMIKEAVVEEASIITTLYRRTTNTVAFANLEVPMQRRVVRKLAGEAGIGLDGIRLAIKHDPSLIGSGFFGHAAAKGPAITLYPDAFQTPEILIRTLGHERTHIYQFRTFGKALNTDVGRLWEAAAIESEESWLLYYFRNKR